MYLFDRKRRLFEYLNSPVVFMIFWRMLIFCLVHCFASSMIASKICFNLSFCKIVIMQEMMNYVMIITTYFHFYHVIPAYDWMLNFWMQPCNLPLIINKITNKISETHRPTWIFIFLDTITNRPLSWPGAKCFPSEYNGEKMHFVTVPLETCHDCTCF